MEMKMLDRNAIREKFKDKVVLFVDDDKQISFSWEKLLGRSFGKVFVANNGKDGLETYKAHAIDIVISDITMPVMDGLDMAKALFEYDENCKIIFMTGHNENEYADKLVPYGGIRLIKPVDMEEFFKVVLGIL
jgi:YesN/AraC family two-component response regulator